MLFCLLGASLAGLGGLMLQGGCRLDGASAGNTYDNMANQSARRENPRRAGPAETSDSDL